jgi:hypothetical protein
MKTINAKERSGKAGASLVTVAGLILVWAIVWANFPSKEELLSVQSGTLSVESSQVPALDLTIPGVSSRPTLNSTGAVETAAVKTLGGLSAPRDSRARKNNGGEV